MKRRLNILCVIVVLVLSYSIFETAYYFVVGVKAGLEAGIESDTSAENQRELINMKYISLLPEHLSATGENGFFQDSVYNGGQRRYAVCCLESGNIYPIEFSAYLYLRLGDYTFCPSGGFH